MNKVKENWRFKNKVRYQTAAAIRRGLIIKKPCRCGNENSEVHHRDYSNPCDIEWLCRRCHEKEHKMKTSEYRPIRDWMDENKLTTYKLALITNFSPGAVSKWRQNISKPTERAEKRIVSAQNKYGWTPFPARLAA